MVVLASPSDGAQRGWVLIPEQQTVEAWPARGQSQRMERADVAGAGIAGKRQ
jgi:hypothetical protein